MTRIYQIMEEMLNELSEARKKFNEELAKAPEGRILRCKSHGKMQYFVGVSKEGQYQRKRISIDDDLTKELARKEYVKVLCRAIARNVAAIKKALASMEDLDPNRMIGSLPKAYRQLPSDYFFFTKGGESISYPDEDIANKCCRHKGWAAESYKKSTYKPEHLRFMSSSGVKVRSKSELLIVEELNRFGVPFRYEQVLDVGDGILVPDFTFRDCNGNLFFWEHAGMMEHESYRRGHTRKIGMYEAAGIVPWKNLIITYDMEGIINIPLIRSIVEHDVIPRL